MARIVGGCLSQFHNENDVYEMLIAYGDGTEIGHVVSKADAISLTKSMAEELGIDNVAVNAAMLAALIHLRDVIAPSHVTLTGHVDFKTGALEVIDTAISHATPVSQAVAQSESNDTPDTYENRAAFLIAWHGEPGHVTQRKFPEWHRELCKVRVNSADETLWLAEFAMKAVELRKASDNQKGNSPCP